VRKTGRTIRPLVVFSALWLALILLACERANAPAKNEWFVQSWNPSTRIVTLQHNGNTYTAHCDTSYMLLNHDPHVPSNPTDLWRKDRPCGELIHDYVGHSIPASSNSPDRDGWIIQIEPNPNSRQLILEKNVPYDKRAGYDTTKHRVWYQETYNVISVEPQDRRE
jgi:hypothetical protein